MTTDQPMTAEQATTLKRLAEATYELEAFQPSLTRAEAHLRFAMLTAKLNCLTGRRIHSETHMPQHGFPPPWIVEELDARSVVKDSTRAVSQNELS
jgi:hypothetical protein